MKFLFLEAFFHWRTRNRRTMSESSHNDGALWCLAPYAVPVMLVFDSVDG